MSGMGRGSPEGGSLARALSSAPTLLMLDEPTQGLDQPGAADFYELIEAVRTGCGCTSAEATADRVEPGETIEVRGTLTLRKPETKRTYIALWLEGGHEQRLWIKATAERP